MRRKTVSVNVGIVDIGSNHSIKTQSMTTASTLDTNASVEEAIRIIDAGGKLVRFTAPNTKEAENLERERERGIRRKGEGERIDSNARQNAASSSFDMKICA